MYFAGIMCFLERMAWMKTEAAGGQVYTVLDSRCPLCQVKLHRGQVGAEHDGGGKNTEAMGQGE